MQKILIVAGEPSGDLHASEVVKQIRHKSSAFEFYGMGGELMEATGVKLIYHIEDSAVMGISEVLTAIPRFAQKRAKLKRFLREQRPSVIMLVDFSGFNLNLAKFAHRLGCPVVYYFPPKAWAWRPSRARTVAQTVSAVAAIFPFEADFYRQAGAPTHFVGHPLLDIVPTTETVAGARAQLGLDPERPVVGLMPGSRRREVNPLLPVMREVANRLCYRFPDCQFVLPLAPGITISTKPTRSMHQLNDSPFSATITTVDSTQVYTAMRASDLMIIASGTATLEAALVGTPMIIIYKFSALTWWLSQRFVQLTHSGLPNIIAGEEIVPELLQDQANVERVTTAAEDLLANPEQRVTQQQRLATIRQQLGASGAATRVADLVLSYTEH